MIYDCLVIGKGLIGSAAAKYLSEHQQKIAVIGADEPADISNAIVYASHYDQARIQRIIGTEAISTLLNLQSASTYNTIEKESNIIFHNPAGCLYVQPNGHDAYLENAEGLANQFNLKYKSLDSDELQNTYSDYKFTSGSKAILEAAPAGFIDPRALIKAQLFLCKKNNGNVITDVANNIIYKKGVIEISTAGNKIYKAKKVLLCTGSFINTLNLTEKKLLVTLKSETTLWAKVSRVEAFRLSQLPSLLFEIETVEYKNIYLIQPVLYPDGNYYVKMGGNLEGDIYFNNLKQIQDWFISGNSDQHLPLLKNVLLQIMPALIADDFFTKRCIVSYTKHGKPYIGALNDKGLFVAAVGNGYSAMCSDALGNIAANLILYDYFPEEYAAAFQPIFV